uniref:Uncharacterized protein n=2 Tax=Ciona intestinalis TaxID=7719 RepID=F6TUM1_CIOIN
MAIAEISQPIQCSDGDNITYKHKVFSNTMIRDIPNLQETEDGCLVSIYRNHLNQYIKIRNSADDGIGWVLIDSLTITGPLELSDILPQPVIEAVLPNQQPDGAVLPGQQPNGSVLPDQQANEAVLLNENAIAALPRAAIEEAMSGQSENEAVLPDEQAIDGVLPDMDDIVLEQDNAGLGLDQPDEVVPHQSNG